jgi:dipeptidyl aminopeptidase/acylaminoacyl peptidase
MRPTAPPILLALLLALPAAGSDLEARAATLARIGGAWSPSFSPDGSRLAFVSDLSGVPQVWTLPISGGYPERVTPLEDPIVKVRWSPAGALLAFSVAPGGAANEQVWVSRPDGTGLRLLTDGGRERNRLDGFTRDASRLRVASNGRSAAAIDAYLLDPLTREASARCSASGASSYADVSCDDRFALLSRSSRPGGDDLLLVDLESGAELLLTPPERPATVREAALSPDSRTVWLSTDAGRDLLAFARIRLAPSGAPGPIEVVAARDDAELSAFAIDGAGLTAVLVWNVAGRSELAFVDLATLRSRPGPALPAEVATDPVFSPDGSRLALVLSGPATSADIWLLERARGTFRQVTRSPRAGVDSGSLAKPTLVRISSRDGLPIPARLYRPRGAAGPGPLVLSLQGGPEASGPHAFAADVQALVAEGISVLAPSVRGSAGSGRRFASLDDGPLRRDAIEDVAACVDWAVSSGLADPKRVGVLGVSGGGYLAMAALAASPDRFAAAATLAGFADLPSFLRGTEPWLAAASRSEYGDPETDPLLLATLSPARRLEHVTTPTLVLHGANDTICPVEGAELLVRILDRRAVPTRWVVFPDEGHVFRKTSSRVRATVEVVRWFATYLAGPT